MYGSNRTVYPMRREWVIQRRAVIFAVIVVFLFAPVAFARFGEEQIAVCSSSAAATVIRVVGTVSSDASSLAIPMPLRLRSSGPNPHQWSTIGQQDVAGVAEVACNDVASQELTSCFRLANGTVRCPDLKNSTFLDRMQFTTLVAGPNVTCGLTSLQRVRCWSDSGLLPPYGILPDTPMRLLSGGSFGTDVHMLACALRADQDSVYCWGDLIDTPMISVPQGIVQMSAYLDTNAGQSPALRWFGVTGEGSVYTAQRSLVAHPLWPLSFGVFVHVTDSFALRNDGMVIPLTYNLTAVAPPYVFPFAVRKISSWGDTVVGVRSNDSAVFARFPDGDISFSGVYATLPRAQIWVDSVVGDDTLCQPSNSTTPCRSLYQAVQLLTAGPATILLALGTHSVCDLMLSASLITIAGDCNTADTANCPIVVDCSGCSTCIRAAVGSDFLTIRRVTFINSTDAAISYFATVMLDTVQLQNHTGGVIVKRPFDAQQNLFLKGSLTMINCSVSHNTLTQNESSNHLIHHQAGEVLLDGCIIVNNRLQSTDQSLMVIRAYDGVSVTVYQATFSLVNCVIANNSAVSSNGLVVVTDVVDFTVADTVIADNVGQSILSCQRQMGLQDSNIKLQRSDVSRNNARLGQKSCVMDIHYDEGSVILVIDQCTFDSNTCQDGCTGGAVRCSLADFADVTITDSSFTSNSADLIGGAMHLLVSGLNLKMTNVRFEHNTGGTAGALSVLAKKAGSVVVDLQNASFLGNIAADGPAGAVSISAFALTLSAVSVNFSTNSASEAAGALGIWATGQTDVTCSNCSVSYNYAGSNGGGFALMGTQLTLEINLSNFSYNGATNGAALYTDALSVHVSDTTFADNSAIARGGAAYFAASALSSAVRIENAQFVRNQADEGGAMLAARGSYQFSGSYCANNAAVLRGGCLSLAEFAVSAILNSTFLQNLVTGYPRLSRGGRPLGFSGAGGGISIFTGSAVITNCNFTANTAAPDLGGGICATSASVKVISSAFVGNMAAFGGAVGWTVQTTMILSGSIAQDNVAVVNGGAFHATEYGDSVVLGLTVQNNSALSGGGGYIGEGFDKAIIRFISSNFTDNTVAQDGAGLLLSTDGVTMDSITFRSNTAAAGGGGGLYWALVQPQEFNVLYLDNRALYGSDKASKICVLQVVNASSYNVTVQSNGKNFPIHPTVVVEALDCLGQRVTSTLAPPVTISAQPLEHVQGITSVLLQAGIANFSGLYIRSANASVTLHFSSAVLVDVKPVPLELSVSPCPAGTFADADGECSSCPPGRYAPVPASPTCSACAPGYVTESFGETTCSACLPGSYASGNASSSCISCASSNGYSIVAAATECEPCDADDGLLCSDGLVSIRSGYWGYDTKSGLAIRTDKCLAGFCNGGAPIHGTCSPHRLPDSPLCGQCQDGYVSYMLSATCARCPHDSPGMIVAVITLSWAFVFLVMYLSSGRNAQTADLKVLFFFLSSARIILGPASTWTQWLSVFESSGVVFGDQCVIAASPYNLNILEMLFPLLGLVQLAVSFAVAKALSTVGILSPKYFSPNRFIRTALALLTFSFSSVTLEVFQFLQCVPAGHTRVVLFRPALNCDSAAYSSRLPFVYTVLALWIVAFPMILFWFLHKLHRAGRLHDTWVMRRWGFLYATYHPRYYWFEVFVLARRAVVSGIAVLLLGDSSARSMMLTLFLLAFLMAQIWLHPYSYPSSNTWDTGVSLGAHRFDNWALSFARSALSARCASSC